MFLLLYPNNLNNRMAGGLCKIVVYAYVLWAWLLLWLFAMVYTQDPAIR